MVPTPGQRHGADDDADQRAGKAHRKRLAGAVRQSVAAGFQRLGPAAHEQQRDHQRRDEADHHHHPGNEEAARQQSEPDPEDQPQRLMRQAGGDRAAQDQGHGERQSDRPGIERRVAGEQQIDQRRQRQDQEPFFPEGGAALGNSLRGMPTRPRLPASRCTAQKAEPK